MRFDTLDNWLVWLESHHPNAIDLGLERVADVASRLPLHFPSTRIVTIGGTNGKGSCVAAMDAALRHGGYSVGCYTSPHLLHFNERIVLDGQPVADVPLMQLFAAVDDALQGCSLTYFEFTTLAALLHFSRQQPDVALLEVGLGGRLDAVNILDADVAVVTSIDIDHRDWLGETREQIGAEKAGIFRSERPAICGDVEPPASIEQTAKARAAHLLQRSRDFGADAIPGSPASWRWWGRGDGETGVVEHVFARQPQLPFDSVVTALQGLHGLGLPLCDEDYQCVLDATLTARLQTVELRHRAVLVDVAHNPAAAAYLAGRLSGHDSAGGQMHGVIAIMADKDYSGVIAAMAPVIDRWYVAGLPGNRRALAVDVLELAIKEAGACLGGRHASVAEAVNCALDNMDPADRLIVFGSFYTVADTLAMVTAVEGNLA